MKKICSVSMKQPKPRNPHVVAALQRSAGRHHSPLHPHRQAQQHALRQELGAVSLPRDP